MSDKNFLTLNFFLSDRNVVNLRKFRRSFCSMDGQQNGILLRVFRLVNISSKRFSGKMFIALVRDYFVREINDLCNTTCSIY